MGPIERKLRKRYEQYSHAKAVPHGENWAIEVSAGRRGVELLNDESGKVVEFLSKQTAWGFIAKALDGL